MRTSGATTRDDDIIIAAIAVFADAQAASSVAGDTRCMYGSNSSHRLEDTTAWLPSLSLYLY